MWFYLESPQLLEDVLLLTRQWLWFLQDGAPVHFSLPVWVVRQALPQTLDGLCC
jgi:hypothetical protein